MIRAPGCGLVTLKEVIVNGYLRTDPGTFDGFLDLVQRPYWNEEGFER